MSLARLKNKTVAMVVILQIKETVYRLYGDSRKDCMNLPECHAVNIHMVVLFTTKLNQFVLLSWH